MIRHLRERALAAGAPAEHIDRVLASDASTMLSMLEHLNNEHGGIHAYLDKFGLTHNELQTLVARLCS
nr:tyrosine-protein phosphatase [Devosia aurantiaca]